MAYAGTKTYIDGTVLHMWMLSETSQQLACMCAAEGLPAHCEAKSEYRRREILGERLLVERIVGQSATLRHNADDDPYLEGCQAHITIAHTRGLLCIGLNATHRMGVDVERYGRRVLGVRDFYVNDEEKTWLDTGDVDGHMVAWMAKEAIFKAVGERQQVGNYASDITVDRFATPHRGQQLAHQGGFKATPYYLHTTMGERYMITFACAKQYIQKTQIHNQL